MNRLMEQLTSASKVPKVRRIDLRDALQKAVDRCSARSPVPSLEISPVPMVLEADPEAGEFTLINALAQEQAAALLADSEEYFGD
jgi:hypothetical protein